MTPEQERELADAIVACGVGRISDRIERTHCINGDCISAAGFIRDWRVAGAMLQLDGSFGCLMNAAGLLAETDNIGLLTALNIIIKDPIAINQAIVAALRGKDDQHHACA